MSLGVDVGAGRRRGTYQEGSKLAWRFEVAKRKLKRIRRLQGANSGQSFRLFAAGLLPGVGYGAAINGIDDQ